MPADFNAWLVDVTTRFDDFLYTYILVILLVFCAIYFTVRTRFVQIRYLKDMFTQLTEKRHVGGDKSISSFQAMMVSTASRVGTGNIAGIATAVALGGPGAIFWMWLMALFGAASAFVESTLAQIWKVRGKDGEFRGGPAYYIQQALGQRWLGVVFAALLIICYAYGFNGLQAYNMASALEYYIPDYAANGTAVVLGIVLMVMTAFVIFGGSKRISIISSILVPIMAVAYLALGFGITIANIGLLPQAFSCIFQSAFDFQSIFGGFAGSVVVLGLKRGLFSNEAGMGSAPNAAATASVSHPVKQGLVQTLSVYLDTMLVCTCSAFIVLIFYVKSGGSFGDLNGMPLVQMAINSQVGEIGIHVVTFAIFCFAFSSLIGNYFYAESNIRFITKSKAVLTAFRVTCLAAIMVGCLNSFTLAWNFADITMAFMAIVNLVAIFLLGKWALKALDDYTLQRKLGKDPVFVADAIEGLPVTECWHVQEKELEQLGPQPVREYFEEAIDADGEAVGLK
ncbi:MAG: alanine/glycine:cation symporter family protein [Eggerthellaceae bacterium]|nr:alanine/glycine:cation symporter family protein [Eggerthellaceae bacterium]